METDHAGRGPLPIIPIHELVESVFVGGERERVFEIGNGGVERIVAELELRFEGDKKEKNHARWEVLTLVLHDEGEDREDLGAEEDIGVDVAVEMGVKERSGALEETADVGNAVGVLLDVVGRGEAKRGAQFKDGGGSGKHDGTTAKLLLKQGHHL